VRLKNGNTLISGNQHKYVREVNPQKQVVWELGPQDLDFPLYTVQEAERLANGNTIVNSWVSTHDLPKDQWPTTVQVFEVTPDKKFVWQVKSWTMPNLGPGSSLQALDEPDYPVEVENEANLAARAEFRYGADAGVANLVYLNGQAGVGAGIIADGQLLRGGLGYSGEIGHVLVRTGADARPVNRIVSEPGRCLRTKLMSSNPSAPWARVRLSSVITIGKSEFRRSASASSRSSARTTS